MFGEGERRDAVCAHRRDAHRVHLRAAASKEHGVALSAGHVLQLDGLPLRHTHFHRQKGRLFEGHSAVSLLLARAQDAGAVPLPDAGTDRLHDRRRAVPLSAVSDGDGAAVLDDPRAAQAARHEAAGGRAAGGEPDPLPAAAVPASGHELAGNPAGDRAGGLHLGDCLCGHRSDSAAQRAAEHHDLVLQETIRLHLRLYGGDERHLSALLRAGPLTGLPLLQLRLHLQQGPGLFAVRADDGGLCDAGDRQRDLRGAGHRKPAALHAGQPDDRPGRDRAAAQI